MKGRRVAILWYICSYVIVLTAFEIRLTYFQNIIYTHFLFVHIITALHVAIIANVYNTMRTILTNAWVHLVFAQYAYTLLIPILKDQLNCNVIMLYRFEGKWAADVAYNSKWSWFHKRKNISALSLCNMFLNQIVFPT